MSKLQHFQKYKLSYEIGLLFCYFFINNTLLATSIIMEAKRSAGPMSFQIWEPFVWEYSSALGALLLFPAIVYLLKKLPFSWLKLKQSLFYYFFASVVFSLSHVVLMVGMRELAYFIMSGNYDFGDIWYELFYEYRKDLWSFIFFIIFIQGYNFILSRLQGEASPVAQSEDETETTNESIMELIGFLIKIQPL